MTRWQVTAALALLCTTSGCHLKQLRTANEDLERENFQLEQRLDELTWQLEDAKAALETCQRAACAAGQGQSSSSTAAPTTKPRRSSIFSSPSRQDSGPVPNADTEAPRVELPDEERGPSGARRPREFVPRFAGPPIISPPNPEVPEGVVSESSAPSANELSAPGEPLPEGRRYAPVSTRGNAPGAESELAPGEGSPGAAEAAIPEEIPPQEEVPAAEAPPFAPAMEAPPADAASRNTNGPRAHLASQSRDARATALAINPKMTVWRKTPGETPVDEGLRVVVEARNAQGNIVPAQGVVAIAVIDPAEEGATARLARWDFSPAQAAEHFHGAVPGGGYHFDLQWPTAAPERTDLLLFVRLTTQDGQQFVAELALRPTSANSPASWTEAQERPATTNSGASSVTAWRRATTPLPPREPVTEPPKVMSVPGQAEADAPVKAGDATTPAEPTGPNWSPYR